MGFNVRANASARNSANQKGVEIRYYSVIYDLVDDVKAAASGLLSNAIKENFIGYANIKEVFKVTGVGKVAGCLVTEGVARRSRTTTIFARAMSLRSSSVRRSSASSTNRPDTLEKRRPGSYDPGLCREEWWKCRLSGCDHRLPGKATVADRYNDPTV